MAVRYHSRDEKSLVKFIDISPECSEEILWEVCTQFGPVVSARIPLDRQTGKPLGHGTVQFASSADAEYMLAVLERAAGVTLFGKLMRVVPVERRDRGAKRGRENADPDAVVRLQPKTEVFEIGAKLMVRNVDRSATFQEISEFFGKFGDFAHAPRLLKNDDNQFRGACIISYTTFESSDAALAALNDNAFKGRTLRISYALKPDGSGPHGSLEERALYASKTTALEKSLEEEKAAEAAKAVQAAADLQGPSWAATLNPYQNL